MLSLPLLLPLSLLLRLASAPPPLALLVLLLLEMLLMLVAVVCRRSAEPRSRRLDRLRRAADNWPPLADAGLTEPEEPPWLS